MGVRLAQGMQKQAEEEKKKAGEVLTNLCAMSKEQIFLSYCDIFNMAT